MNIKINRNGPEAQTVIEKRGFKALKIISNEMRYLQIKKLIFTIHFQFLIKLFFYPHNSLLMFFFFLLKMHFQMLTLNNFIHF